MVPVLEAESTLTDRYQTTVPEVVRAALKLGKRDKVHYAVQPDGSVLLSRVAPAEAESDPVLDGFLAFLAADMAAHPERLRALDAQWAERLRALAGDVAVDLDAPLSEDDE
ncbi:type II toxin-antitoxin system PrlF family antitoxin [Novispirillum sp. DQ9]|uniref:type II toxin-antitoxin system PrlF family antitoxin n=1 Tax=Novispirillum sp. DQ9 TaxID=3398612 RepID=UPI003C7E9A3A